MARTHAKLTGERCVCRACGEYFSTTSNFDKHRKGDHKTDSRFCADPETVGLVIGNSSAGTFWRGPSREV